MGKRDYRCPSAQCKEGAELLGVVQRDGTIGYLGGRTVIDSAFVQLATKVGKPEQRLRFSDRCVEGKCKQWTGTQCGVINNVIAELKPLRQLRTLPKCSIRSECRWYSQAGADACAVCPLVVTEITE